MNSDRFDATVRSLASSITRRASFGAILAAAGVALTDEDGAARKFGDPQNAQKGKRRKKDKGGNRKAEEQKNSRKNKRENNNKDKNKDKKSSKNSSSGSGSNGACTNNYTEKEILGFIQAAAKKYGQNAKDMERVARCESVLDPCAVNRAGPWYGLFQYLKSTWRQTPYGNESIWDPEAQSMATAWMWKEGRKNEWACK
jgi:hypothetical protein